MKLLLCAINGGCILAIISRDGTLKHPEATCSFLFADELSVEVAILQHVGITQHPNLARAIKYKTITPACLLHAHACCISAASTKQARSITSTTPCFKQDRVVLFSSNTGATMLVSISLNGRNEGDAVEVSAERRNTALSWGTALVSPIEFFSDSCKRQRDEI